MRDRMERFFGLIEWMIVRLLLLALLLLVAYQIPVTFTAMHTG
jgi:hypothetical protein